jgi:hypothetical protein
MSEHPIVECTACRNVRHGPADEPPPDSVDMWCGYCDRPRRHETWTPAPLSERDLPVPLHQHVERQLQWLLSDLLDSGLRLNSRPMDSFPDSVPVVAVEDPQFSELVVWLNPTSPSNYQLIALGRLTTDLAFPSDAWAVLPPNPPSLPVPYRAYRVTA